MIHIMETKNNTIPAMMPVHPGEILQDELKERGLTQKAFAAMIGMRPSHLNELLHGKTSFTISIADKIQKVLGIDSMSWMNLQTQYNYDVKALESQSTEQPKTATLQVSVEDASLLADIKRAISLIRGVNRVAVVL